MNSSYLHLRRWLQKPRLLGSTELAQDRSLSFGQQEGWAISVTVLGQEVAMGEELCLSWLPCPLNNSKRFWYLMSQRRHREKTCSLNWSLVCFTDSLLGWFFITWIGFVRMTNYLIGDLFCSIWVSSADAPLINRSLSVAKSSCCLLGYEDVPDFFQHLFNLMKQKRATAVCSRQNCVSNWRLRFLSSVLSLIWYAAFRTLWSAWNSCYGLSYGAFPSCLQRILCHLCISRWWKEAVHSVVLFSWIILVSVLRLFHFVVSHCLCRLLSVHSDDILSSRITAVGWRVGFFTCFTEFPCKIIHPCVIYFGRFYRLQM